MTLCTLVNTPTFLRRFSCSGVSHCAVGCLVSDISKEYSTSFFRASSHCFGLFDSEDEGTMIIWIVKNYTHHDMASQPNKSESSATWLKTLNLIMEERVACIISVEAASSL